MTNEQAHDIVEGATQNAVRDVPARRSTWIAFGVLLACILAAVAYYGPRLSSISAHAQEQDTRIGKLTTQSDKNATDANALADQVRALGATPVVQPAPSPADGRPGATGTAGLNGRDGEPPPCLLTVAQCQGADGGPGIAGTDGKDGVDGQPGKDGADGKDGQPGRDGVDGTPGPACPAGYEPRPAVITAPDGSTYQGVACVDPATSQPPETDPPILPLPTN